MYGAYRASYIYCVWCKVKRWHRCGRRVMVLVIVMLFVVATVGLFFTAEPKVTGQKVSVETLPDHHHLGTHHSFVRQGMLDWSVPVGSYNSTSLALLVQIPILRQLLVGPWTVTQRLTVEEQAALGCTAFDVRLACHPDNATDIRVAHAFYTKITLDDCLRALHRIHTQQRNATYNATYHLLFHWDWENRHRVTAQAIRQVHHPCPYLCFLWQPSLNCHLDCQLIPLSPFSLL